MIIILGRKDQDPRIITGVTQARHIGTQDGEYFGWWRDARKYGVGFNFNWLCKRFDYIFVVDGDKLRKLHGQYHYSPQLADRVSNYLH